MADITHLLAEAAALKLMAESAKKSYDAKQEELVQAMRAVGQKTATVSLPDEQAIKGTLVEGTRITIDEARLKQALDAKMWKKITKEVLDTTKLEAAVALNEVDANVVAACSTEKDVKPYVKISGTFNEQAAKAAAEVSIRDTTGKVKPAARRVKPLAKKA